MDVVMPELDGIIATRRIVKELPDQIVVILTGADDEDEIGLQALRAGATGYLSKDLDIEALPRALEGARTGEAVISRRMTKRLIEHVRRTPESLSGMRPVRSPLTAREWEVIDLLRDGRSTEAIADDLVLSIETVRSHIKNILRKLDVRSRQEAVEEAERMRTAAPPDDAA
jgi:DNA-binding NarL/FixJ family response regulator